MKVDSLSSLPLEAQVSAAVSRKAKTVQEQMGQATLELIEAATPTDGLSQTGDRRGQLINTRA